MDKYNQKRILKCNEEFFFSPAKDIVLGDISTNTNDIFFIFLKSIKKRKVTELQGLPNEVTFKLGIKYMITFNAGIEMD